MSRSKAEMRLIRQATAYKRLLWRQGSTPAQRALWQRTIDRLEREAERIRVRHEARS